MKLSIVTAVCGAVEITRQWIDETIARTITAPEIVVVSNGDTEAGWMRLVYELEDLERRGFQTRFQHFDEPMGSTRPFNAGLRLATGDVVAMLHNDLMVRQQGWDAEVLGFFMRNPQAGVVGFHGSRMLGHPHLLYRAPYELHQLARGDSVSNMEDAESHGARSPFEQEVVTVDGMALIARRDDLMAWGGLDERYIHHMYDHDLCLMARQHGRRNYMLPIVVRHISGQTANMPRYNERFAELGGDAGVHTQAHYAFWLKWRGTGQLPAHL